MPLKISGPILGARPITPGDFDNLSGRDIDREKVNRTKYLVKNQLEVPSHIYKAYQRLKESGGDWRTAKNEEIFGILETIPHSWGFPTCFNRLPSSLPPEESAYHDFMHRIDCSEDAYLSYGRESGGGHFIDMLRDARSNSDPNSFYPRLIRAGIMKVNSHTLLVDMTLNSGLLQAVQECEYKPAVIMTYFTFWRDGKDQDKEALAKVYAHEYRTTHWLTEYYDVFDRKPGNGFVTCTPTIYIRKPAPEVPLMKRVADHVHEKPRYTGGN